MSCTCLNDHLKEITKKYPEWDGKKVKKFSYSDSGITFPVNGKVEKYHGIGVDIQYENQKKIGHTLIIMTFCPFCGKKL